MTTNGVSTNGIVKPAVGFIGLGSAGWPVASNLPRNGYSLYVYDADASKAQHFAETYHCTAVTSPEEGFRHVDILITMLPNGDVVRDVLFGPSPVARSLKRGCAVVDMSSADPFNSKKLAKELEGLGVDFLDCPITQRKLHDTDHGKVTIMVGAKNSEVVHRVMPVLKVMSKHCFIMGDVGAGHVMKTINNYIMASSICALADSFIMGSKFGLDPGTMLDVLNVGTGRVFATENTMRDEGLTQRYQTGFQLALLVKDLGICQHLAEEMHFDTPLPKMLHEALGKALKVVEPDACHSKCLRAWEKWGGISLNKLEQPTTPAVPVDDE